MRRSFLPILVFLLFYVSAFSEAGVQTIMVRCLRPTIESYPEDERRPVLQYLDEVRQAADEFMRLFAEGKFDEIYKLDKEVGIWVQGDPAVEVDLATFERQHGRITHYEYRNQDVVYSLATPQINLRGTVGTWYAVKTMKSESDLLSLLVEIHKARDGIRNEDRWNYKSIFFKEWDPDSMPTWLRDPNAPIEQKPCPGMKDSLQVKASG